MPRFRRELLLYLTLLLPLGAAAWIAWRQLGSPPTGTDDADIFLTYARHWLAGDGLVFSQGGERVEGFSSPLWLLICAAALALTPTPEFALRVISVGLACAAVTAATSFAIFDLASDSGRRGSAGRVLRGALAAGWSLAAPAYSVWTGVSLMDTALHSACLCLGAVAAARAAQRACEGSVPAHAAPRAVCSAIALLLLARSEGIAEALGLALALGSAVALRRRSAAAGWRAARPALATFALVLGLLLCARLAYFGYPFPNTYYAKVSPDLGYTLAQGATYLFQFGVAAPLAALAVGCSLAGAALCALRLPSFVRSTPAQAGIFSICALCAVALLITVLVGGDHFALFRIAQPVWPLLPLPLLALLGPESPLFARTPVAATAISALVARETRWPTWFAGGCAALGALFAMVFAQKPIWPELAEVSRLRNEFALAHSTRFIAARLNQLQRDMPPLRVGVLVCGGFGYAYRGPVVDLLGLNLVAMAHAPGDRRGLKNHAAFDAEVLFALAPELLFPDGSEGVDPRPLAAQLRPTSFENRVTRGLLQSPRFQERYAPVSIGAPGDPPGAIHVTGFARNDVIRPLRERGLEVRVFHREELGAHGSP